jgi:membrane protein
VGDRRRPRHAPHRRHGGLRRAAGHDEPHLGGPPGPPGGVWAGIRALLKERRFSLALVFALAFLLLVSLVISAVLAAAAALFQGPEQALVSRVLELAVSLLILTIVITLLFTYVPDAEIRWRDVWLGGLITAALFTLGKTAIGYYLGQAGVGSAYGASGSLVMLLVRVYYSALIMFFGAEFTHAWAMRHGPVTPQPHAGSGAAPQTKRRQAPSARQGDEPCLDSAMDQYQRS